MIECFALSHARIDHRIYSSNFFVKIICPAAPIELEIASINLACEACRLSRSGILPLIERAFLGRFLGAGLVGAVSSPSPKEHRMKTKLAVSCGLLACFLVEEEK